jgi:CubicO group peptidase (beta-lactamase class C family)
VGTGGGIAVTLPAARQARAELLEFVLAVADEGISFGGGQIYASRPGASAIDIAFGSDGLGNEFVATNLSNVYCAGKPLLALVVGRHVSEGRFTLDTRLEELLRLRIGSSLARLTVRNLLSHTSGLYEFGGVASSLMPESRLHEVVEQQEPVPGFRVGTDIGYTEYVAWHLLARVCEVVNGDDYRRQIRSLVLGPLGIEEYFDLAMSAEECAASVDRLRVNESFRGGERYPILLERSVAWRTRWNPAFGFVASACGLGRFYEQVDRVIRGEVVDAWSLCELARPSAGPAWDPVMNRDCSYALGFMANLSSHRFGDFWSANSVGHSGNVGMTAAGVDLDSHLVVAFHLSGLSDGESAVQYLRPVLMSKVARCFEELSPSRSLLTTGGSRRPNGPPPRATGDR